MATLKKYRALTFRVARTSPERLSLTELGVYLTELEKALGPEIHVYLKSISTGSACVNLYGPPDQTAPEIRARAVQRLQRDELAPKRVESINIALASYGRTGVLLDWANNEIVAFAGCKPKERDSVTVRNVHDSLVGRVVRLGGIDDTIPVSLQMANGVEARCNTSRANALALKPYLLTSQWVRVRGPSTWERDETGVWHFRDMKITEISEAGDLTADAFFSGLDSLPSGYDPETMDAAIAEIRGRA